MLKVIVTGVGRSGTTFLAKLLTSMNLPCGHESIFDYSDEKIIKERLLDPKKRVLSIVSKRNGKGWIDVSKTQAESSYLAVPYLDWPELDNTKIIHVFRNPVKVARSFIKDFNYFSSKEPNKKNPFNKLGFEEKIWKFLPELSEIETQEERFCYFYYHWNKLVIEKSKNKKVLRIKIENQINDEIIKFLNLKCNKNKLFKHKKENTFNFNNNQFDLSEIPKGNIKSDFIKIIKKLGYYF
jgi:hypothetical protein